MRHFAATCLVVGLAVGVVACKKPAEPATDAEQAVTAPDAQTGPVERTGPDEQTGPVERTGPDEQTGPVERTGPAEQ